MKLVEVHEKNGLTTMNTAAVAVYKGTIIDGKLAQPVCLGSGFLVYGQPFQFMTAKHVVDFKLRKDEIIYILYDADKKNTDDRSVWSGLTVMSFELVEGYDIALGYLDMAQNPDVVLPGLMLADECNRNAQILNVEFSAASADEIFQSMRYGNIVYIHDSPYHDNLRGVNVMETSFACLRGASGSPVIDAAHSHYAIGMMIQNIDHELAPTQVIRAEGTDGKLIEEVKYLMPQGLAISAYGIQKALAGHFATDAQPDATNTSA